MSAPRPRMEPRSTRDVEAAVALYFAAQGWAPLPFQREVWQAMREGRGGLLHATTGAGKTLAVALGALQALEIPPHDAEPFMLWVTPMRALAADTARALDAAFEGVVRAGGGARWSVGARTGDTGSHERAKQARRPPAVLVTTPESLSLMLSRPDARAQMAGLSCVVVDEWHELMGNKRGVQTQLALARLRRWRPEALVWGMSATLGNLNEAKQILLGPRGAGVLVKGGVEKTILIDTLLPGAPERFPWSGYLGLKMLPEVLCEIEASASSLVFTNTRSQAEIWYREIARARPDWAVGIHHGSLEKEARDHVERGLKGGALKAVVCTSSLDLGVDFLPVERVLQIGSAKGVARLLQRAGRSGHAPGRPSRVTLVPSHALELVESAAVQAAAAAGHIESRTSPIAPLDVLCQHLVTAALGGGFRAEDMLGEVRDTIAYRDLDEAAWTWCLDFVRWGGPTLRAYADFRRCEPDFEGVWRVPSQALGARHRLNIGTITSDAAILVQYGPPGARLGTVEESFIARMKPGERFWFAGKLLELTRVRDSTAFVRSARKGGATIPRWGGGRLPLSTTLADAMVEQFALASAGVFSTPELSAAEPMLKVQSRWSALPNPGNLLAETLKSGEGWHLFLYPFAGRNAHLGLSSLIAWRAGQTDPATFSIAVNDYGFELLSASERDWAGELGALLDASLPLDALTDQVLGSVNASELARRRFRDIARISGLVVNPYPGMRKSARQVQASSSLFYDVFQKYDPDNGLLRQAVRELLEDELDIRLLHESLVRMQGKELVLKPLARCSPLAFPLMEARLRESLSNETVAARIERMVKGLEEAAAEEA